MLTKLFNLLKHIALNIRLSKASLSKDHARVAKLDKSFNRILIRDSTTQGLPRALHEFFPGNYSRGNPTAVMRLQTLFNFTEHRWEYFNVGSYRDNEISILKFTEYMIDSMYLILQLKNLKELQSRIPLLARAITYQKRSKRKNTMQKYLYVNELCITFY